MGRLWPIVLQYVMTSFCVPDCPARCAMKKFPYRWLDLPLFEPVLGQLPVREFRFEDEFDGVSIKPVFMCNVLHEIDPNDWLDT